MSETVTILTPSYNRAGLLPNLYDSLKKQNNRDFRWLIVDDGSTDDTGETVKKWIGEGLVPIRYIYKENGGKHTALNRGIAEVGSVLTFIVDSDDRLTPDAVSIILEYYEKYRPEIREKNLCGFSFLRAYSDGKVNAGEFPVDEAVGSYCEQRINAGIAGDKAEVFLTEALRKYPFPEFAGEKFVPEDAVWMQMSGPMNMVHINRIIYISDYLEGGLTKTGRRMKIRSPYGMMYRSSVYLKDPSVNFKTELKMMLLYRIYQRFAAAEDHRKSRAQETPEQQSRDLSIRKNLLYHLCGIPSWFLFRKWSRG